MCLFVEGVCVCVWRGTEGGLLLTKLKKWLTTQRGAIQPLTPPIQFTRSYSDECNITNHELEAVLTRQSL